MAPRTCTGGLLFLLVLGACGDGEGGPDGDMAAPTTPTDLTAQLIAANTVDLTWSLSVDNVGVTGYRIFRDGNVIGTAPGASFTDQDAPAAEVCYTVSAFDAAGNESGQSDPACLDLPRSWIVRAAGVETNLEGIAWSGSAFAAVGSTGGDPNSFMISADGRLWRPKHHQRFSGGSQIEWVGDRFVAFTDLGIYVSPDGSSGDIMGKDPLPGIALASDIVWSGSELIAVGPGGLVFTSPDVLTWTERTSNTTEDLRGAVWSGSQLVAVGDAGTILTSTDGLGWTQQTSGTNGSLERVAWSGAEFLALGFAEMVASPDGTTWTPRTFPPGDPNAIAGSPDLDLFATVGWNGLIATSPDGTIWTQHGAATSHGFFDVIWAGDQFIAVGEVGTIASSSDGATWDVRASGDDYRNVAWLDNQLVAVGVAGKVSVSSDGIEWTHGWTGDGTHVCIDIAWSGSTYVIGGYMWLLSSPDLQTWTGYSIGPQECRGVIWTGTAFAAACTGSGVRISPNGTDWTTSFIDGTFATDVNDIAWTGTQYVVVGEAGTIMTSPDGSAWTPRTSGTLERLHGVAWSGSRLVAVGEGGTIFTSTDGAAWAPASATAPESLYDVSWLDGQFVAVGGNQTILLSPDGVTWEDRSPADSFPRLNGVSSVNGKMVVVAEDGHILMSP